MHLSFQIISPEYQGSVADQAESCIEKIQSYLSFNNKSILGITVFVNADKNVLLEQKQLIFEHLIEEKFNQPFPTAYIAEPCTEGYDYLVEIHAVENHKDGFILKYKDDDDFVYAILEGENSEKYLFVTGISKFYKDNNVTQSTKEAFKQMKQLLKNEGMDVSNIYRQWNYIEGIIQTTDENGQLSQNYQDFNDVRAKYYDRYQFTNGYPAATGIGTIAGGINISFYAHKGTNDTIISSVKNPLQTEAFDYSEEVLIGEKSEENYCKAAPKFDRAKYLKSQGDEYIFISGTAAIRGEETLAINNVKEQTDITIKNMLELLKKESLTLSGIESDNSGYEVKYIKVYVKNKHEKLNIKEVCDYYFPNIPKAFVIADVCRDNLLVEIEGIAKAV